MLCHAELRYATLQALGTVSLLPLVSGAVEEGLMRWLRAAEVTCDRAAGGIGQRGGDLGAYEAGGWVPVPLSLALRLGMRVRGETWLQDCSNGPCRCLSERGPERHWRPCMLRRSNSGRRVSGKLRET